MRRDFNDQFLKLASRYLLQQEKQVPDASASKDDGSST